MRIRELFNDGWHFHKGDIHVEYPKAKGPTYTQSKTERFRMGPASIYYNSSPDKYGGSSQFVSEKWEFVRLPHDYIISQTPSPDENNALGYFKYENAWYRKIFTVDAEDEGKRLVIEFEGVATNATVYLNGCLLAHNFCGYTSFEVDVTDFVKYGVENVLAVYVNAENHEGWWYEGAGIYRNVWLLKTDEISVDKYGVYVKPQKLTDTLWNVDIETTLISIARSAECVTVVNEIVDGNGQAVARVSGDITVDSHDKAVLKSSVQVEAPILWDIDAPYLYEVRTQVIRNGETVDTHTIKTGFRYFRCDPDKGFFLNGRHVKIKGVCAHEDCGLLGKAVPANVHRYKTRLIKQMGANGYRTSHYQQNDAILDSMDEQGLIVFNEARWFSSSEESIKQLETLIKRDRNRPSVFFWSLGNEEPYHATDNGKRITKTLMEVVKRLDDTRVITSAVDRPVKAPVFDELDLIGINYNLNVYDDTHEKYPDKCIVSSENCATGSTRSWYYDDCPQKGYLSAYDKDTNKWFRGREYTWKYIMDRDFIMGGYQWDAFEHRGETVWPRLCSQSGAIDLFLQKKDAFYQNQSHWLDTPMIHMLPHWNIDAAEGESVRVWAYTNCEEAELFLNKKSLGRAKAEKYTHLEWNVPYEKGEIEVVGYNGGEVAASERHVTAGAPKKLFMRLENDVRTADDVSIISCYTVDENGNFVPNACPTVEFFTNTLGNIIATGSDISDHCPVTDISRKMREGYISVAVGVSTLKGAPVSREGKIEVYARSEGLTSARLQIDIEN